MVVFENRLGVQTCGTCGHQSDQTQHVDGLVAFMDGDLERCDSCKQFFCNSEHDGAFHDCFHEHRAMAHPPRCLFGSRTRNRKDRCQNGQMAGITLAGVGQRGGYLRSVGYCEDHREHMRRHEYDPSSLRPPEGEPRR